MVKAWLKQTPSFISLYTQPYTASSLVTHPLFPGDFPGDPAPSHVLPPPTLPVDQSPLLKIWSKWCSRWTIQPSRNGWKITGDSRTDWRTGGSSCTIQLRLSSLDAMERKWDVEFFFSVFIAAETAWLPLICIAYIDDWMIAFSTFQWTLSNEWEGGPINKEIPDYSRFSKAVIIQSLSKSW